MPLKNLSKPNKMDPSLPRAEPESQSFPGTTPAWEDAHTGRRTCGHSAFLAFNFEERRYSRAMGALRMD